MYTQLSSQRKTPSNPAVAHSLGKGQGISLPAVPVLQRVKIPHSQREDIYPGISEENWILIEEMLDTYKDPLSNLGWHHGTSSSSLVMALLTNGEMLSAGELIQKGYVPLSGEAGNSLSPFAQNTKGISGVDTENLDEALHYTKPKNQGGSQMHLSELAANLEKMIGEARLKIKTAVGYFEKNFHSSQNPTEIKALPFESFRGATMLVGRLVWSLTFYGDISMQEKVTSEVNNFNTFLGDIYLDTKVPEVRDLVAELMEAFNNTIDHASEVDNDPQQKNFVESNFPVVYSATGGDKLKGSTSHVKGETLLEQAHFRKQTQEKKDNSIQFIFVPFAHWDSVKEVMTKAFQVDVLPMELLEVYKKIK